MTTTKDTEMLTTTELIERMTPTALAETIASIQQGSFSGVDEIETIALMWGVLVANVGENEAEGLLAGVQ